MPVAPVFTFDEAKPDFMNRDPKSKTYRAYVMFILVVVYTFNFIDRQIVGILAVPIKSDLGLSDTQLGLMGGLAFALFYTGLGIPVAMLADRSNRTWIMTVALTVWSAMTAVCGLAQNFWQLFLARLGVGVGEAGGVAPAYSLIADYFPPHQRARAMGVYSFGIPIGSALGILFGGYIASTIDWRYAFFIAGIAGVLVAPVFKLTVREPPRGQYDSQPVRVPAATLREVIATLRDKQSFWLIAFGASASSMMGYGLFFWLPSLLVRSFDMALFDASVYFGAILLIGGLAGTWAGGALADRLGKGKRSAYAIVPAVAFLLTVPFFVVAIFSSSLTITFFALLVPIGLGLAWLGPVIASIQQIVPANMRATASAVFLFVNNLIGLGLGNVLLGAMSDGLSARFGDDSLRYAILAGSGFYVVAALLFFLAARRLERDWQN